MATRKTNGHGRGFFGPVYRSYLFKEKDPDIDHLRTIIRDEGVTEGQLHAMSGVSTTTFKNWFRGPTKRPTNAALTAAGAALGYERAWTKKHPVNIEQEVEAGKRWLEKRKRK